MDFLNRKQYKKKFGNEHFAGNSFTVNDEVTLTQLIREVRYYDERNTWFNDSIGEIIDVIFTNNFKNSTSLAMHGKGLGANEVKSLVGSFPYLPNLTNLNLSENKLEDDGAIALAGSLQFLPKLLGLHLDNNSIGNDGAIALAGSLQFLPNLAILKLSNNSIGADGAIALAGSLQYLPYLTVLYLNNNSIGADGVVALATSFQYLPKLAILKLSKISMGDSDAMTLAASFQYLPELTILYLCDSSIGPKGATALVASLQYLTKLTSLSFERNLIGVDCAIALAGSLQYLSNLATLNLSNNSIGDNGATALAGSLQYLPNLTVLNLYNNSVNVSFRYYYHYVKRFTQIVSNPIVVTLILFPGVTLILNTYTVDGNFLTKNDTKYIMSFTSAINLSGLTVPVKMKIVLYDIVATKNINLNVSNTYSTILDDLPIAPIYATINITNNSISVESIKTFCSKINKLYELKNTGYPTITYTSNGGSVTQTTNKISPVTEYKTSIVIPSYSSTSINTLFNTIQYTSLIEQNKDIIIANIQDYFKSKNIITTFYVNVNKQTQSTITTHTVTIHFKLDTMSFVGQNVSALLSHTLKIEPKTEPNPGPRIESKTEPNIGPNTGPNIGPTTAGKVTVNDETTLIQFITTAKYDSETQIWSNNSTNDKIDVLFTSNFKQITYLDLSNDAIEDNGAVALTYTLQNITSLTHLILVNNSIGIDSGVELSTSLQYLRDLVMFTFCDNPIGRNGAIAMAASLRKLINLKFLALRYISIKPADTISLAYSLEYLPNLTHLTLGNNSIGGDGGFALGSALQYLSKLTQFTFHDNSVGRNGAISIGTSLRKLINLEFIALRNISIKPDDTIVLMSSLQYLSNLTELNLDRVPIGGNGMIALGDTFQYLLKLAYLNLSNNSIESTDAMTLAGSLRYLPKLTNLNLNNNSIGPNGTIALAASCQYLSKLTGLHLSNNSIGENGAIALADSLQYLPYLTKLDLSGNSMGDNGAIALAASLQYLPDLTTFNLSNNPINASVRYYYHYVTRFPNIVSNPEVVTPIDFQGVSALSQYTSTPSSVFLTKPNIKYIMRFPLSTINLSGLTDSGKIKKVLYDIVSTKKIILNVSSTYATILDDLPIAPIYATIDITNNSISEGAIMTFCSKINKLYKLNNAEYPTITYTYNNAKYTYTTNIISPVTEYITTIKVPNNEITHINTLFNTIQYTSSIKPNKDKIIANIRDYFKSNDITTTFYVNVNKKEGFGAITYTVTIHFVSDVMPFIQKNAIALLSHDPNSEPFNYQNNDTSNDNNNDTTHGQNNDNNNDTTYGQNNDTSYGPSHKSSPWIHIILSIVIILIFGLVYYKYKPFMDSKLFTQQ